jgi:tetratricopeptide (TPR) repeat protein
MLSPFLRLVLGRIKGGALAFEHDIMARVQCGDVHYVKARIDARVGAEAPPSTRNAAINALISVGAYREALLQDPPDEVPQNAADAGELVLCQINLAEAEYNLGRWDEAEARLCPLDLAGGAFDITRAGLLQQRAWIAVHRGRPKDALDLCGGVTEKWLPAEYRVEYHFTRAAAFIAATRVQEAEAALDEGRRAARRPSSKRNAMFLRARLAAARGDWAAAEQDCRTAANHRYRSQGGDGLLLWAEALEKLGRGVEAMEARRLVVQRDPESEAARIVTAASAAASA